MRNFAIVLVVLLIGLQFKLWRGDGGILEVLSLKDRIEHQKKKNVDLAERNEALGAEVKDLQVGLSAIEERARVELGMIRKDETFYQVVDPDD
jgi:cell division protein FtsB